MRLALIADIGGTHARFELAGAGEPRAETLRSGAHATVEDAIDAFLRPDERAALRSMALAVAGPVEDGRCTATNLPWVIDERALAARFGVPARLLNDFEAVAHGIDALDEHELAPLQAGRREPDGTIAVLGAGTGLGEALVVRAGAMTRVIPTEGGHTDFGPWDARTDRVLARLRDKYRGHVSVERVASGLGLADWFEIVCAEGWAQPRPATLRALIDDPGRAIGEAEDDPAAALAVGLFTRALGAEAGNLALKSLPRGGVRIAGGVVPKLLARAPERLRADFLEGFLDKGRMRRVLERIAVDVVLATDVGLRGARRLAASLDVP